MFIEGLVSWRFVIWMGLAIVLVYVIVQAVGAWLDWQDRRK